MTTVRLSLTSLDVASRGKFTPDWTERFRRQTISEEIQAEGATLSACICPFVSDRGLHEELDWWKESIIEICWIADWQAQSIWDKTKAFWLWVASSAIFTDKEIKLWVTLYLLWNITLWGCFAESDTGCLKYCIVSEICRTCCRSSLLHDINTQLKTPKHSKELNSSEVAFY